MKKSNASLSRSSMEEIKSFNSKLILLRAKGVDDPQKPTINLYSGGYPMPETDEGPPSMCFKRKQSMDNNNGAKLSGPIQNNAHHSSLMHHHNQSKTDSRCDASILDEYMKDHLPSQHPQYRIDEKILYAQ